MDNKNNHPEAAALPKVIAVVGPTASGKTSLAVKLAQTLGGEVISADSMQVYEGMDIGTAKVTKEEMQDIPHHLIDVQPYDIPWNVMTFQTKCRQAIDDITSRGKIPILCGGTGLYVKAALYDYVFEPEEEDESITKELEAMSSEQLVEYLNEVDPQSLEKIHPNNRKRLLRAAAIAKKGKPKSEREQMQSHQPLYDVFFIGLQAERDEEIRRIHQRVHEMFEQGLPEEAARLFSDPKTWSYTSFMGIGYKEFQPWLQGNATLEQVEESIAIHTRQYARRQMTWFRNQMPVHWYHPKDKEAIVADAKAWKESL